MSNKKQLKIVECSEREALRIHGIISDDSTSSEGGKSEFDEEYYNYKPPPIKIDRSKIVVISSLANTTTTSNEENTTTVKTDQTFYNNSSTYVNSSITDNTVSSNSSDRYSSSSINECPPVLTTDKRFTTKGVVEFKSIQKSVRESSTADNSVFSSTVPSTSATKISSSDSSNTPMETNLRSSQTCISAKGLNNDKKFSKSKTILSTNSNSTCEKLNSSTYVNSSIPVKTLSSNSSNRCSSLSINACPPVLTTDKKRKSKRKSTRKSPTADNSVFSSTSPSASVTKISSSERSKSTMETLPRSSKTYIYNKILKNETNLRTNSNTTRAKILKRREAVKVYHYNFEDSTSNKSRKSEFDEEYYNNKPPPIEIDRSKIVVVSNLANITMTSNEENTTTVKTEQPFYVNSAISVNSSFPDNSVSSSSSNRYSSSSINVCPPVHTTDERFIIKGMIESKSTQKSIHKSSTADNLAFSSTGPSTSATKISSSGSSSAPMETHLQSSKTYVSVQGLNNDKQFSRNKTIFSTNFNSTYEKLSSSTYVNSSVPDNTVSSNSFSSINVCPPILTTDKIPTATYGMVESKSIQKSTRKSSTADNSVFSSLSTCAKKISSSDSSDASMETHPESLKTCISEKKRCSQKILVKPILSNQQDNDNEPAFDEIVPEIIDEPLITYDEIHLIGEDIEEPSNSCFNCCIIL